jgi:hypothetical protein
MNETEFFRNLSIATGLKFLSRNPLYYDGYIRGLRRFYHGKIFLTEEEHRRWLALVTETGHETSKAGWEGYQHGLSGETIF